MRKIKASASELVFKNFRGVDGIRGVLCVLVAIGHYGVNHVLAIGGLEFNFAYSVSVFFVISGFVLSSSNYYGKSVSLLEFSVKRLARLCPMNLVALGVAVIAFITSQRPFSWLLVLQDFFCIQNIGLPPNKYELNFPSWSVSVELWCSLIFFCATRVSKKWMIFALTAILVAVISLFLPTLPLEYAPWNICPGVNVGMLNGVVGFALGISLYHLLKNEKGRRIFLLPVTGWCSLVLLLCFLFFDPLSLPGWPFYLAEILFLGVVISNVRFLPLLDSRPLKWLGKTSFSTYLLHMPVLFAAQSIFGENALHGLTAKTLLLTSTLLASGFTHRYIEIACQNWVRRALILRGALVR